MENAAGFRINEGLDVARAGPWRGQPPGKVKTLTNTARVSVLCIGLRLAGAFDTPEGEGKAGLHRRRGPDLKGSPLRPARGATRNLAASSSIAWASGGLARRPHVVNTYNSSEA